MIMIILVMGRMILISYKVNDAVAGYGDQSQYNADNVDDSSYSGDAENDSQDSQDIQGQYGVDSLEQYGEDNLGQYEEDNQPQQYGDETQQENDEDNLEKYVEEYDIQDDYEEEPLAVGSTSPEYDPVKDVNDFNSKPADDLYGAPLEENIIETTESENDVAAINFDKVSDSYGVPSDDLNAGAYIAPDEGDINVTDDTYGAPSELVDNKPADELYDAPTDGDISEINDNADEIVSTETIKDSANDSYSAPLDDSDDDAYIAPVKNDASSPDDTYGSPVESVGNKSTDDTIVLSEETDLIPPPVTDDVDTEVAQSDYAAPANPLENEYLSPATSPTSDYTVLGSDKTQVGSVGSHSGSSATQTCPGGSIERCVSVCPGVTARVYGACVHGCANRCS